MTPITRQLLPVSTLLLLAGCASTPLSTSNLSQPGAIQGSVHGGQQPVSGSTIQLYASGTTGDGSAATPLLTSPVLTTAGGGFTLTGLFTCPSASSLVYLVATGGNPGLGAGGNNPQLALMAALGPCGNLTPSTFISVNEVTTVGAVYGLADYMTSFTAIGSGSTDATALGNAFTYALELVNTSTGSAPGANIPTGTTVPVAQINTIADAMASCINSPGGVSGDGSACGTFIGLTTPSGITPPTNSIGALLNLALNPTLNTTAIYNLIVPSAPFQPIDPTQPANLAVTPNTSSTLIITPTSVTFPPQTVGYISPVQTVTVQNSGAATVTFSPTTISGINSAEFAETSSCGTLAGGASCQIQLTVTPNNLGTRVAALTLTSNTAASPQTIALTGTGAASVPDAGPVSVSPNSLAFTYAYDYLDVTLTNYGTTPLHIQSVSIGTSSFDIFANNCGSILAPQSACTITIESNVFACTSGSCTSEKTASDTLTIVDDAPNSPQTVSLSSADTEATSGPFGFTYTAVGSTSTQTVTVSGYSSSQQAFFSGTFTGANAGDFSASPAGCIGQVGGGSQYQNCTFNVTFKPTASGPRTAKLQSSTGGGYIRLNAIGTGGTGTYFNVTSSSLVGFPPLYNNVGFAAMSATPVITNFGSTTLNFASPQIFSPNPTPFTISNNNCTVVAPNATCALTINFSVNAATSTSSSYFANLVLTDSNSSQSALYDLSFTLAYHSPVTTPSQLSFGPIPVGTTSATQSFTVSDTNSIPLGHPIVATFNGPPNGFTLPLGSTCPASTTTLCTIGVAFQPAAVGAQSATLTLTDQVSNLTTQITLSGTGTPATSVTTLSLSTNSVTFPLQSVNTTSTPMPVTITNTGNTSLTISGINILGAVNANYTQTNNCTTVAVNGTCAINITFAPTATGTQTATIQILSNALSSPDTVSITGSAN